MSDWKTRRARFRKENNAFLRVKKIEEQLSAWDGSHRKLEARVKKMLTDPGSYEHITTRYKDEGDKIYLITAFRAKNAYGGYVEAYVEAKVDIEGNIIEISEIKTE